MKLANLGLQGWAGILYLNIFCLKCLWETSKHRALMSFTYKLVESGLSGVCRNNIYMCVCEYLLLFEMPLGRHQNTEFCTWNWRIGTCGGGHEKHIWISSFWNDFGRAWTHRVLDTTLENELSGAGRNTIYVNIFYLKCLWEAPKHQVLQIKLENLAFQECSWIIYLDIFYLKCLRKVSKHRVLQIKLQNLGFQERAWIIYFEYLLFEIKTPSFANKNREFKLSEADRKNIIEYLLFKKPLGRHQNTQLCTWNWRIWAFRGGQE